MAKKRTRKEKERVRYHLEGALLDVEKKWKEKDKSEFAYLEARYVKKDLIKSAVYVVLMLMILLVARLVLRR